MAMDAGDETVGAGTMAKAIYDELTSQLGTPSDSETDDNYKKIAAAIAVGVVNHITGNAETDTDGEGIL